MNRLKELRKEKGLSQVVFSKEIGIPLRTLQSWENGESQIKPDKAKTLADHFGVSAGYLLGYTPFPKQYDDETIIELADGSIYAESKKGQDEAIREMHLKNFVIFLQENFVFLTNEQIEIMIDLLENLKTPSGEMYSTVVNNKEKYSYMFSDEYSRTEIENKIDKYEKYLRTEPKKQKYLLSLLEKEFGELRLVTNIRDVLFNAENDEINNNNKDT